MSVLSDHVGDILLLCSQEQVVSVHTGGVVAFVQNPQPARVLPLEDHPGSPVSQPAFSTYLKGAIAVPVSVRLPLKAIARSLCLGEESVG